MKITFLTVGKNSDRKIEELTDRYVSRLKHYVKFEHRVIADVKTGRNDSKERQKQLEGNQILAAFQPSDHVVLLDERGKEFTSTEFAALLDRHLVRGTKEIFFVVGGPFGFSPEVYARANAMLSLSRMTLTHEMVRLFFTEQLYRAFTIINGESYHHE